MYLKIDEDVGRRMGTVFSDFAGLRWCWGQHSTFCNGRLGPPANYYISRWSVLHRALGVRPCKLEYKENRL